MGDEVSSRFVQQVSRFVQRHDRKVQEAAGLRPNTVYALMPSALLGRKHHEQHFGHPWQCGYEQPSSRRRTGDFTASAADWGCNLVAERIPRRGVALRRDEVERPGA